MPNEILTSRLQNLLRSPALRKVNFELQDGGLVVTHVRFTLVDSALSARKITCDVAKVTADSGKQIVAQYIANQGLADQIKGDGVQSAVPNMFLFPNDRYGEAPAGTLQLANTNELWIMVHEATHAIFDVMASSKKPANILAISNEMAACLAASLWYVHTGMSWQADAIIRGDAQAESMDLAWKIRDRAQTNRTTLVPRSETQALRMAVMDNWNLGGGRETITDRMDGV
ncbi:hypothetical protein [Reyranella sp. CPCC 100927]|uniref:hypothetical protein n=1 Tax=Reyranella sp. CPCC 100927 TaxID=2599616 RepID=UPI0011B4EBDD|nr:hypothetical protein [Reyranella sp. CPCC 100927]TWT11579.1 hypothetical protein FQU96_13965 [Reyranella sp. CPCC 100927]